MTTQKFKIGKAKKIKVDENSYLVVKLNGKVPNKICRQLKLLFNEAVSQTLRPIEPIE